MSSCSGDVDDSRRDVDALEPGDERGDPLADGDAPRLEPTMARF